MWSAVLTSRKRPSRGSGSTLSSLLSTTWLEFLLLLVGSLGGWMQSEVIHFHFELSGNTNLIYLQGCSFPSAWCYSRGWARLPWRCHPSLWFCPHFYSNGNEIFGVLLKYFVSPVCFPFVLIHKNICPLYPLHLYVVTLNPLQRSWRPDWVPAGGRAACLTSASTSAWARCVARPPNSVC